MYVTMLSFFFFLSSFFNFLKCLLSKVLSIIVVEGLLCAESQWEGLANMHAEVVLL